MREARDDLIDRLISDEIAQQVHGDGSKSVESLNVSGIRRAILTALSSAGIDCEGWRTIESAPKDGTEILVPYPIYKRGLTSEVEEYRIIIVFWKSVGWDTGGWMLHEEPKHWRPLPLPPLASGGGE